MEKTTKVSEVKKPEVKEVKKVVETPVVKPVAEKPLKVKLVVGKFYYAFDKTFPNGQAVEVTLNEMRYLMNQTNGAFEEVK